MSNELKDKLIEPRVASYLLTLITRLDVAICMQFLFFINENNFLDTILEDYIEHFVGNKAICSAEQLTSCITQISNKRPVHDIPFDIFGRVGKDGFLYFLSNILSNTVKERFKEHIRQQMCVPNNNFYDDLKKICALRNYLEHKSQQTKVLDFILLTQTTDKTDIALESLFKYLPLEFANEVCQLLGVSDTYLSKLRKQLREFNTQYNWRINVKGRKNQSDNTKIHRKRLFAFVGKSNMDHISDIIDKLNESQHINKNLTDPERIKIFNLILQIHATFRRYIPDIHGNNNFVITDDMKKLRNNIAHSHLFFTEDKNYFNQVKKNINTVLDFFETNSQMIDQTTRSNFMRSIFSILNKKDYKYIVMKTAGQMHNVHIIEIKHIEKQKKITNDYIQRCAELTIYNKKQNPNNTNATFVICKRHFFNMFRQALKHTLIGIYPRNKAI